ncbi:conjugal transfer protein [Oceanobacillus sp. FSL K6-0251]|uniref:conjugal transfer protein n=1 Tax=Oceanobacillus sp. FSL K6-0251 TaxID=2921602 RepID=UPI0030FC5A76
MRVIFNYRKALREPKKIRQITEFFYLPFPIELIPTLNFFLFLALTFLSGYVIRQFYPYAFADSWVIFLIGIPLVLTTLVKKIKPEGKNIYIYIYDFIKYVFMVKMPNKQFINDRLVEFTDNKEITFRQCVKVVDDKNGKIETSSKDNKKQYAVNERGRRIRILPNQEQINSNPEQKSS